MFLQIQVSKVSRVVTDLYQKGGRGSSEPTLSQVSVWQSGRMTGPTQGHTAGWQKSQKQSLISQAALPFSEKQQATFSSGISRKQLDQFFLCLVILRNNFLQKHCEIRNERVKQDSIFHLLLAYGQDFVRQRPTREYVMVSTVFHLSLFHWSQFCV